VDLSLSLADEAFRTEVRAFLAVAVPPDVRDKVLRGEPLLDSERDAWYRALYERGWMAPAWPAAYGGAAWTPIQRLIFDEEASTSGAPLAGLPGVFMLGPILIAFASEEQKARYLPRTLSGEIRWCQGYTEPGSGSDLASLQTRAVPDGDEYVVDGQKIWITQADRADMMFCLVRTSTGEKKQEGISFLLIDMTSPGIMVRPIKLLSNDSEICEVFFDGVRVPVANRVGNEGEGWTYATRLLEHERSAVGNVNRARAALMRIREFAAGRRNGTASQLDDPTFANALARLHIRLQAATFIQLRAVAAATAGERPGPESSLLKIIGTEITKDLAHLAMSAIGYPAIEKQAFETIRYFDSLKLSILSGSNEIQRNIVAKRILGL
jgi:alkylation response protein AidB-like acyl-CoA dehydrogenase